MSPRRGFTLGALALVTCAAEPAPAELVELCGVEGPVRVLELSPDERLVPFMGLHVRGDRLVVLSSAAPDEGGSVLGIPGPTSGTARSVGLCGEEPVVLGHDLAAVRAHERWPDILLGCVGALSGDLVVVDPAGVTAPSLLVPSGCKGSWTDHGLVDLEVIDDTTARVLFYPYPDDPRSGPIAPVVLLDPIQRELGSISAQVRGDEVFALDLNGAVVRVTLPTGDFALEQADALAYKLSGDGRYLVWQDALSTDDDGSDTPAGDIVLRDRVEGGDSVVGHVFLDWLTVKIRGDYLQLSLGPDEGVRLVELATRATLDLPPDRDLVAELDDGRLLLSKFANWGPWYVLDPVSGDEVYVAPEDASGALGERGLYVWRGRDFDDLRHPAALWRYSLEGGPGELLARRAAGFSTFLRGESGDDERLVTFVDIGADWRGRLVLVDPDTLDERPIDEQVAATVLVGEELGPDTVGYAVVDGERSGVWLARLAPRG